MNKIIRRTILELAAVALLIAAGFCIALLVMPVPTSPPAGFELPTIEEVQREVGTEPDGILGPKTQEKWDKYIIEQYAKEVME